MKKLLVTGKPFSDAWKIRFEDLGFTVVNGSQQVLALLGLKGDDTDREISETELAAALNDAEVYVYGGLEPASELALDETSHLKLISFLGTGWSDPGCVDPSAARKRRIRVANTPHANAHSVAEFALAAIIASSRDMFAMAIDTRAGGWTPSRGRDVADKTLAIVGLGAIGATLARFCRALDMRVLYYGPHAKPELEQQLGVERREDLAALVQEADFLSVHAPANSATEGLIDKGVLQSAPRGMTLVNVAAPEIVDGQALLECMKSGQVSRAVFDGRYPDEQLNKALVSLGVERFVQFPRSAWLTDESYDRMAAMSFESVKAYTEGAAIPHLVLDTESAKR